MKDPVIGHRLFVDGVTRAVYADGDRQYVLDDGQKVYGIYVFSVEDQSDTPVIVEVPRAGERN